MGNKLPIFYIRAFNHPFTLDRIMVDFSAKSPSLHDQLKAAVEASSIGRGELAKAAGISRKTLFNLLEADQDFRVSTLLALADVLKLDITLSPIDVRGLRLTEPSQRGMSDHSIVGDILGTIGKDERWK